MFICRYVFVGAAIGVYFLGCFLAIESKNSREWVIIMTDIDNSKNVPNYILYNIILYPLYYIILLCT